MRKKIILSISFLSLALFSSCAEKKTRIWIDPPPGGSSREAHNRKLYYQVEDMQTGKKENLIIPIEQTPENLIVEKQGPSKRPSEVDLALATRADRQIFENQSGQPPQPELKPTTTPTVSYLLGMEEVESRYQQQNYTQALVRITPLIEQYGEQSRLFVMQGTLFKKIGEKKLAYQAYKKAFAQDKNNPQIEEAYLRLRDELGEK